MPRKMIDCLFIGVDSATVKDSSFTLINWDAMPLAWRDVLEERQRQQSLEGWAPEHDDLHVAGELLDAAICYINTSFADNHWPWDESWWKPSDERRNMIKAAALILAEIERLDRAVKAANHD